MEWSKNAVANSMGGVKTMGSLGRGCVDINWNSPLYESTPTVIMPPPGELPGFDFWGGGKLSNSPQCGQKQTSIKIASVQAKGMSNACVCLLGF